MSKTAFSGHSHTITKDYEAIRCEGCKEIMKVPLEDLEFKCLNCGHVTLFVEEEIENA